MAAANHEKSLKKGETRKVVKTNETEKKGHEKLNHVVSFRHFI